MICNLHWSSTIRLTCGIHTKEWSSSQHTQLLIQRWIQPYKQELTLDTINGGVSFQEFQDLTWVELEWNFLTFSFILINYLHLHSLVSLLPFSMRFWRCMWLHVPQVVCTDWLIMIALLFVLLPHNLLILPIRWHFVNPVIIPVLDVGIKKPPVASTVKQQGTKYWQKQLVLIIGTVVGVMLGFLTIILQLVFHVRHSYQDVSIVPIMPRVHNVEVDCVYTTISASVLTLNKCISTVDVSIA